MEEYLQKIIDYYQRVNQNRIYRFGGPNSPIDYIFPCRNEGRNKAISLVKYDVEDEVFRFLNLKFSKDQTSIIRLEPEAVAARSKNAYSRVSELKMFQREKHETNACLLWRILTCAQHSRKRQASQIQHGNVAKIEAIELLSTNLNGPVPVLFYR